MQQQQKKQQQQQEITHTNKPEPVLVVVESMSTNKSNQKQQKLSQQFNIFQLQEMEKKKKQIKPNDSQPGSNESQKIIQQIEDFNIHTTHQPVKTEFMLPIIKNFSDQLILETFHNKIVKELLQTNPDLESLKLRDLGGFKKFITPLYQKFQLFIDQQNAFIHRFNEICLMFISNLQKLGNYKYQIEMQEYIHKRSHLFVINGDSGIGKSTFIRMLMQLSENNKHFIVIKVDSNVNIFDGYNDSIMQTLKEQMGLNDFKEVERECQQKLVIWV